MRQTNILQIFEDLFRSHPVTFPIGLSSIGFIAVILQLTVGIWFIWYGPMAIIFMAAGLILFPFGLATAVVW